jgi:tetratricopeptide (TPR) repeat protein
MRLPLTAERIHREIVKLLVLVSIAAAAFVGTRAFAAASRRAGLRDAARWYDTGQQRLASGDVNGALEALRRATLKDRANQAYALALARAEARAGQRAPAERTLLALRDLTPENPEINLELARAAAARDDVSQAVRYYHHAIYGLWPAADGPDRVRLELIRFLLDHGERRAALAELLAATTDTVAGAAENVRFGRLFLEAGEPQRARDHFERALRRDANDSDALAGAGVAAFRLGDYRASSRYLRTVSDDRREARELRELANLVLALDPLEPRLAASERRRRLTEGLAHLRRRVEGCASGAADALRPDLDAFEERLASRAGRDRDTIEDGLELVYRAERSLAGSCGALSAVDRAWLLVGERHGVETS